MENTVENARWVSRKNFPKNWWNCFINPITGERSMTATAYRRVQNKPAAKWS